MASIQKEITVNASTEQVWDAMRDIGALHTRLAPGFVIDTKLEGDVRHVSFANGLQASERIVTVDAKARRLVWSATGERLSHHNGVAEVKQDPGGRTRIIWTIDLLPDSAVAAVDELMEHGMSAIEAAMNQLAS
jgi:carbon monoxide dehydrogenase subunit G